ncbi:hypothetical protein [Lutibacter sp.]|uniref:DUF6970 domain-containing protein n=1 Tax=Lutibacter sp. TaxID=1925666 RepID=UPI00356412E0
MKNILTFLTIGIFTLLSCEKSDLNIDAPTCIKDKIEEIMNNNLTNPPTQVWKWEVDGETYYYITSDCCDQFNNLYTENCTILCAPDGGITGNGDGNCPDFTSEINKTLVWKDNRN